MSYIDIHQFDPAQVKCELVTTGPRNAGDKPKTQVKMSYGPNRRAIGFLTPPCVLDWPRLTGDGNLNTKYGPTEPDKAAYTCGLTDRPVPEIDAVGDPGGAMKRFFNVIREIDNALIAFVHANQRELLGVRDLTLDNIRGKANQTVKPKYDESGDLLIFERMNVATRNTRGRGRSARSRSPMRNGSPWPRTSRRATRMWPRSRSRWTTPTWGPPCSD
jgi:hypothetical protein